MYKEDLVLNNLQWLMCHKTKPNYNSELLGIYLPEFFFSTGCLTRVKLPVCSIFLLWVKVEQTD